MKGIRHSSRYFARETFFFFCPFLDFILFFFLSLFSNGFVWLFQPYQLRFFLQKKKKTLIQHILVNALEWQNFEDVAISVYRVIFSLN